MKKILLFSSLIALCVQISFSQISILEARQQGEGATVTISGIITNGDELGVIRYIQDETAGLAIYDPSNFAQEVEIGDSVEVTGELKDFRGLLEIDPVSDYQIISSNNNLPAPQLRTPGQLSEDDEGELVRIEGVRFSDGGGVFSTNQTFEFSANGETSRIFVRSNHPLAGVTIPIFDVTLIGIVSEFEGQYQVLLRGESDIIPESSFFIDQLPVQSDISTNSFTVNWTTSEEGTTTLEYGTDESLGSVETIAGSRLNHEITLTNLNPATFYYIKVRSSDGNITSESPLYVFSTQSNSTGDIKVYFNNSVDPSFSNGSAPESTSGTEMNAALMNLIENAQSSIEFAGYNNNRTEITRALNDAHDRGVRVRYIHDDETLNEALMSGINFPVFTDAVSVDEGLMHHKFVVFDVDDVNNSYVLTGSTNFTDENIGRDYNNIVVIQDQAVAKAYTHEFNEMWGGDTDEPNFFGARFASQKSDDTPHQFKVGESMVEVYFSPSDNTSNAIERSVRSADDQLMLALLTFTYNSLGTAVVDEFYEGTDVRVILDNNRDQGTEYDYIERNNVNIIVDASAQVQLHHKYGIVDPNDSDPQVITGSHNWSNSAETRNDENCIIIHDEDIANIFQQEFEKRWTESTTALPYVDDLEGISISVYPIPSDGAVNIHINSSHDIDIDGYLYDLSGNLIQTISELGVSTNQLSLNHLATGQYILIFEDGQKSTYRKIIVE